MRISLQIIIATILLFQLYDARSVNKTEEIELNKISKALKTEEKDSKVVTRDLKKEEREIRPIENILKTVEEETKKISKPLKSEERDVEKIKKDLKKEERDAVKVEKDLKTEEKDIKKVSKALKSEERDAEKVKKDLKKEERDAEKVDEVIKAEEKDVKKVEKALKSEERDVQKIKKDLKKEERDAEKVAKTLKAEERDAEKIKLALKAEERDVEKVVKALKSEERDVEKVVKALKSEERDAEKVDQDIKAEEKDVKKVSKTLKAEERDVEKVAKTLKAEERDAEKVDEDIKSEEKDVKKVSKTLKAEERDVEKVAKTLKAEERDAEKVDEDIQSEEKDVKKVVKALKSEESDVKKTKKDLKTEEKDVKKIKKDLKSEEKDVKKVEKALKTEESDVKKVEKALKTEQRDVKKTRSDLKTEVKDVKKIEKALKAEERETEKAEEREAQKAEEREIQKAEEREAEEKAEEREVKMAEEREAEKIKTEKVEVEDVPARQPKEVKEVKRSVEKQRKEVKKPVRLSIMANDKEIEVREDIKKKLKRTLLKDPIEFEETKNATVINLCVAATEFKYYIPHPVEETKYIQCNPWGTADILTCKDGKIWDNWQLRCELRENVKNLTAIWSNLEMRLKSNVTMNCKLPEFECKNKGVCQEANGEYKCVCEPSFSGEFCEIQTEFPYSYYREIMNNTFSLKQYEESLISENVTNNYDLSYYEKYKADLGNETYELLVKYLSNFNESSIRYDTLLNFLVEDILKDIYPDSFYLTQFNASSQNIVAMSRMIPSLVSFSTYSLNRYEDVFVVYQKVLDRVLSLFKDCPYARNEATDYYRMTSLFVNQTLGSMNLTSYERNDAISDISVNTKLTDHEVREKIRAEFNVTLQNSMALVDKLSRFQEVVVRDMEKDSSIVKLTLGEFKSNCTEEVIRLFDDLAKSSCQIWDSLTSYGFWYITNALVENKEVKV